MKKRKPKSAKGRKGTRHELDTSKYCWFVTYQKRGTWAQCAEKPDFPGYCDYHRRVMAYAVDAL